MARSNLHLKLLAKADEAVHSRAMSLANGEAADYTRYREIVFEIRGIRTVLEWCAELEAEQE